MQALHIGLLVSKCRLCDQLPVATTRSGDSRLELVVLKSEKGGQWNTGPTESLSEEGAARRKAHVATSARSCIVLHAPCRMRPCTSVGAVQRRMCVAQRAAERRGGADGGCAAHLGGGPSRALAVGGGRAAHTYSNKAAEGVDVRMVMVVGECSAVGVACLAR